jgi:protein-disulfide isomerase
VIQRVIRTIALAFAALCGIAVLGAAGKPAAAPRQNWNAAITRTAQDSYLLGNPAAPLKLVAYISYTCSHCAHFEQESDAQLRIGMIGPGKGSLEVRPFLRNPVDLAVTLLAECGPPTKFFANHAMFLRTQEKWMAPLSSLTDAQKERWSNADFGTRMRAMASDLGLYGIMEQRGYSRPVVDRCLGDKALADRLAQHTKDASEKDYVQGTPAFLLNGVPLAGTASWDVLKPQIEARLN